MKDQDDATFLSLSSEYLEAAIALHETPPMRVNYSAITFFLLGHAAELILKGFLYMSGSGMADLKKCGHDLAALVDKARLAGLPTDVELSNVKALSLTYASKGLEYRKNLAAEYPCRDVLLHEVKALSNYVLSRVWPVT
ncbi:hypothetical protein [Alloalcanivorax balearicus]|uniref:hypothetical protein n=1 Tax=Alloalcanivorax balearicus TaxID=413232 RepID=UPI0021CD7222|nr:hypothetical protein [Alloalcanivorax balearicus]